LLKKLLQLRSKHGIGKTPSAVNLQALQFGF